MSLLLVAQMIIWVENLFICSNGHVLQMSVHYFPQTFHFNETYDRRF